MSEKGFGGSSFGVVVQGELPQVKPPTHEDVVKRLENIREIPNIVRLGPNRRDEATQAIPLLDKLRANPNSLTTTEIRQLSSAFATAGAREISASTHKAQTLAELQSVMSHLDKLYWAAQKKEDSKQQVAAVTGMWAQLDTKNT